MPLSVESSNLAKNIEDESAAETNSIKPIAHTEVIDEHPPSVRTGKIHVLLYHIFFNSSHTGLFASHKNREMGGGGAKGPLHKILKHAFHFLFV